MKIGQECGQRWYRRRSWRHRPIFRSLNGEYSRGFAVGPIMLFTHIKEQ